ncbi:hypothetical protein V1478_005934 [Vespula squamosa]|uniref:Uncharacterized protein n=1 Tax=Vespula squamosa TaxID=30214 RepID=A0ABD2BAC4_VESSQ
MHKLSRCLLGASTLPREDSPGIEEKEKEKEKFQVHRRRVRILRKRNDPLTRVKLPHSLSREATVIIFTSGQKRSVWRLGDVHMCLRSTNDDDDNDDDEEEEDEEEDEEEEEEEDDDDDEERRRREEEGGGKERTNRFGALSLP